MTQRELVISVMRTSWPASAMSDLISSALIPGRPPMTWDPASPVMGGSPSSRLWRIAATTLGTFPRMSFGTKSVFAMLLASSMTGARTAVQLSVVGLMRAGVLVGW